ncbi:MAG: GNAT family N-acetyltransferase [Tildeniella nuda ZEHNDER 1965/U140]|jgi:phosphinothricin acetyltransferase|nr:GNAT family N-acetyltransferase [Tildeniella nuda ZEHNDER 1965/U140]
MYIRDAAAADLTAIVAIYNSTIASQAVTADLAPVTVESRVSWFQAHSADKRPLWVMDVEGEVAGWLGFQSFYYGRAAYDSAAELSIYVSLHHRRKGIGQTLLKEAIAQSSSFGIKTLMGFIFAHNQPSLRLFEQFGFQRWGYLPGVAEFETVRCDLVIMGLQLP